ncbi:MAG TPA: sodium:proton antiporter [Candidatus Omnitrophica bacterium]|nr:MAG: sodium:proton antiporter [Omnitrophica WOR_2 bacterium GWA2_53_43]HBO97259.1 sodium:proton antiporter [Candidatus Omnitrophota bacterium]HCI45383.1 sodium:proton antiporter [Candidatus Omnitrophota bacterium]
MNNKPTFLKSYRFSILLIASIAVGSLVGALMKSNAAVLKPLGDIFLNLLFTIVVPLVFFAISSTVAQMTDVKRLGKIMGWMVLIFVVTGIIAAAVMIVGVKFYPPAEGIRIAFNQPVQAEKVDIGEQIVRTLTVTDFTELFSKQNMFALILFAFLIGLAASAVGARGKPFAQFLAAGNDVMTRAIGYVMLYAPVGLGAYFAYLVGVFGPQLLGSYVRVIALYYPLALAYFFIGFSFYAWLAGGVRGIRLLWSNILPAAVTAWGTGSGLATLPVNLEAAKRIGIPEDVREVVVNIGASVHSDGSSLAAVVKMALLFGIFGMPFSGVETLVSVVAVALLCGTVISGIPSGGMLGELLIITLFGFPIEAMPIITMVGTLVDPPATMVNVVGDNVSGMLVARVMNGPKWLPQEGHDT